MGRLKLIVISGALVIMMFGMVERGQGQNKPPGNPKSAAQTSKELRKKQWQHQRAVNRATKAALKAHMKDQTKDVRKRMKKDAKIAKQHNDGA